MSAVLSPILAAPGAGYDIILADPGWRYGDRNKTKNREIKYQTMTLKELAALPVPDLSRPHAVMFMWATMPMRETAMALMRAWGFRYSTVAFTWMKLNRRPLSVKALREALAAKRTIIYYKGKPYTTFMGQGRATRANAEEVLLGFRGRCPPRSSCAVRSEVIAPVREHSRKPDEVRDRIVDLYGPDMRRIEMFARDRHPHFDARGNEVAP